VEYFCNRLGWPQQLIDDMFDLFYKAFAAEASQLCHALSNRTVVSIEQHKQKLGELSLASGESGGGKRRRTNEPSTNRLKTKK
jgi:lysine/ornithine N-monooxygenase